MSFVALFVESVSGAVQQAEIMRSSVNVWLGFFVCVLILLDFEQHSREFVYSNKIAIRSVAVKPRGVFFFGWPFARLTLFWETIEYRAPSHITCNKNYALLSNMQMSQFYEHFL